jgi:hypothetical protein
MEWTLTIPTNVIDTKSRCGPRSPTGSWLRRCQASLPAGRSMPPVVEAETIVMYLHLPNPARARALENAATATVVRRSGTLLVRAQRR